VPDFGIRTALSEFGKAVEGKKFKHPETGNQVLYTSLPMPEQHRIYEQWQSYQTLLDQAPKEGAKVEDIKQLKKDDYITVQGPQSLLHARIVGMHNGQPTAQKVDARTGKPTKDPVFSISQKALDAFEVRKRDGEGAKGQGKPKKNPFKNRDSWESVVLDDVYEDDVIAYSVGGKDRMGRVTRTTPDGSQFWIQEVDPRTGKVKDKTERSFDQSKITERDAKLVDEDIWDEIGVSESDYSSGGAWQSGWGGWSGGKPKKPPKPLTPEEKKKLEEERAAKAAARKKAVEEMGKTGKPLKETKDIKAGDVVSYHWEGEVYHGRVVDARGHEFFTIDIDPKTGELKEHGFEEWRGHSLKGSDMHKVDEEHVPEDPAEANEQALYEGLPKLEEDAKKYFRDDKDAKLVDLEKITPAKVRLKGVLNGNDLLASAAKGHGGKRAPISLIENEDGTYTVRDGNSTYKNAEISDWKQIPAIIKTKAEWDAHDKAEEERKKKQQSLWPSQGQQPKVTKEKPPKEKPATFQGEVLESTEGLEKGDLFGYEFKGHWYVGRVDRRTKDGGILVDSVHPENGRLTTLKYIQFEDADMKDGKAMRLPKDFEFPKKKKKAPLKLPPKKKDKDKGKGKGKPGSGKPFMFASRTAAGDDMRSVLADLRQAYRPLWQDTPGYKTVVDIDSEKGISPSQTESTDLDRGQDNMDSSWPVQAPQSREKERALPLPSNHSKNREKRIGPTTINKPRHVPDRTLSVPGEEYGHPTKYDYNFPTRRNETLAGTDDELEPVANAGRQGPFPVEHQRNQGGSAKIDSRVNYRRDPSKRMRMKRKYQMRDKRQPKEKLKDKYYRMYPHRFKRRGIGFTTPAERTKAWREENKADDIRSGEKGRKERQKAKEKRLKDRFEQKQAGLEFLAEAFDLLGLDFMGANWPIDWNTTTKQTGPPAQLDQNHGKGVDRGTGTPRTDPSKQEGGSLRAPNLPAKHQPGLYTQNLPPAAGAIDIPTTNNPTDGSGKVLPMEWYSDAVNNTQAIPDGRQDRYERNNNFDVKQATRKFIHGLCHPEFGVGVRSSFGPEGGHQRVAMTVADILKRCDKKIKLRSKEYTPKLARTDTKNWIWHWSVGDHTVRVQAFKRGNASNFPKLNLRVSCSCPYWRWWGPAHWATKTDYQKGTAPGTAAYPQIRDPAHWRPVCKHAYAVLEKSQDFFVRPKKSPLRKLGSRFSVDSPDAIEVVIEEEHMAARVAQRSMERDVIRRVAHRYVEGEES